MNWRNPYGKRRLQYVLVLCGLGVLFWLDYLLLLHAVK
jgi:hypothetical protein